MSLLLRCHFSALGFSQLPTCFDGGYIKIENALQFVSEPHTENGFLSSIFHEQLGQTAMPVATCGAKNMGICSLASNVETKQTL